jgi:hypothetical protein
MSVLLALLAAPVADFAQAKPAESTGPDWLGMNWPGPGYRRRRERLGPARPLSRIL